ncbi:pickpocket protein 28-like [Contarinia nasturtii]|uniref:pickpocket protein 28-like n=1 Tax=Contarinia nasturtii TaxID=265458 RepID=UPI0012D422D0|nr:pickpocket protein 28-like [Contarinia nasturtii]
MADIWQKRAHHPVTVTFDDKHTTVASIPFPAVTICPSTRVSMKKINLTDFYEKYHDNWPDSFENATIEEKSRLSGALHMCKSPLRELFKFNESNIADGKTTFQRISDIKYNSSEVFRSCYWSGAPIDCGEFKFIMTERGPCYSFNVLNSNKITSPELLTIDGNPDEGDWSMERELKNLLHSNEEDEYQPKYPYHHVTLDDFDSLSLELFSSPFNWIWNYKCELPITRSLKVFLHRPDEIKEAFDRPFEVEVGKKVIVSITPNVIVTSKYLRTYSSQTRRCFFESERKLKFFNIYTKSNCEHECLANYTITECGCVIFSMPRKIKILNIEEKMELRGRIVNYFLRGGKHTRSYKLALSRFGNYYSSLIPLLRDRDEDETQHNWLLKNSNVFYDAERDDIPETDMDLNGYYDVVVVSHSDSSEASANATAQRNEKEYDTIEMRLLFTDDDIESDKLLPTIVDCFSH